MFGNNRTASTANAANLAFSATPLHFGNLETLQVASPASATLWVRTLTTKRFCRFATDSPETAAASPTSSEGTATDARTDTSIWTAEM
jgi:hypothetical protein